MNKELRAVINQLVMVEVDLGNMTIATDLALDKRKREGACEDEMWTIRAYSKGYADAILFAFDRIRSVLDPYLEDELEEEQEVTEEGS